MHVADGVLIPKLAMRHSSKLQVPKGERTHVLAFTTD